LCGRLVDESDEWVVGHVYPRSKFPELALDASNWRAEHRSCSNKQGAVMGNEASKRSREAKKNAAGLSAARGQKTAPVSSPVSWVPPQRFRPWSEVAGLGVPEPRFFSDRHPDAVGTYWDTFGRQAYELLGLTPRPWAERVLSRGLEFDASGEFCWSECVVSVSRQSGKSLGVLRPLAVARALMAAQWEQPAFVMHVARQREAARKLLIRPDAVKLAERMGLKVSRGRGDESWVWPDGTMWQVFATASAYGETVSLLLTDEGWDIRAEHYHDAMAPTLTEAFRPQEWHTSAADASATSFMLKKREAAIAGRDGMMIAEWSADPAADPFDPLTWHQASPHWHEQRYKAIVRAASNRSMREQFLNIWPQVGSAKMAQFARWAQLGDVGGAPPAGSVAAIERSMHGDIFAVAVAAPGSELLWVRLVGSMPAAEELCQSWNVRHVVVGKSLADLARRATGTFESWRVRQWLPEFRRAVDEGLVRHNHDVNVAAQFADAQLVETENGVALSERKSVAAGAPSVCAVKAAVVAFGVARNMQERQILVSV